MIAKALLRVMLALLLLSTSISALGFHSIDVHALQSKPEFSASAGETVFSENKHPRFMKEFSFHDPYGRSKFYCTAVENADPEKLAKLIGICGMLLQTKVYVFWSSA